MPLVEIIAASQTRPRSRKLAPVSTRKLDKLPLPCRSAPGFVVNRILMPYLNEAMFLAEEGVALLHIDAAAVDFGMPMGQSSWPIRSDSTCASTWGEFSRQPSVARRPHSSSSSLAAKYLGRKSGRGFYEWRDGKPIKPRPTPASRRPMSPIDSSCQCSTSRSRACASV